MTVKLCAEVFSALPPRGVSTPQKLLAVDTSLGSVAAVCDGVTYFELPSSDPLAHAEVIGDLITGVCAAAGVSRGEVAGVVMGVGPGSFTGLRVGMAAATGYAFGREVPLYPLLSHEAVAVAVLHGYAEPSRAEQGAGESVAAELVAAVPDTGAGETTGETAALRLLPGERFRVCQDARRKELFVSEFVVTDGPLPQLVAGPRTVPRAEFVPGASDLWHTAVSGAGLLATAHLRLAGQLAFLPPTPVYLRDPDVKLPAGVKSVLQ